MEPKILYVTTFSRDLWEESARVLIESFSSSGTPGTLVAYVEGMGPLWQNQPGLPSGLVSRPIDGHVLLDRFRAANKSVIPVALGGSLKAPECKCRKPALDVHSKHHRLPCPGYWFCKNAFRWFRKTLAAKLACDEFSTGYDYLVWVDSDASFLKTIPPDVVAEWFNGNDAIILKNRRTAIETGVFGYNLKARGPRIADAVMDRYLTGRFRLDQRWDDCVQLEYGIRDVKGKAIDLATNVGPNNTVIQFSPLGKYLGHDKGRHRRTKKLN